MSYCLKCKSTYGTSRYGRNKSLPGEYCPECEEKLKEKERIQGDDWGCEVYMEP
jgi:hypothetical protein